MPEAEFEAYLAEMAERLGLSPDERAAIADELRDHLESRLTELTAGGVDREPAVRRVLAEFGGAKRLADRFARVKARALHGQGRRRSRRWFAAATVYGLVLHGVLLWVWWGGVPSSAPSPVAVGPPGAELPLQEPRRLVRVLGSGDVLKVGVFELVAVGNEYVAEVRVDEHGFIQVPAIGRMRVAGRSEREVEWMLVGACARLGLADPAITVARVAEAVPSGA
ncbi:MAG: polysaccharide biosynthesis/export family protein [Planctomycetota bacterium]